jgi:hypothetical protein
MTEGDVMTYPNGPYQPTPYGPNLGYPQGPRNNGMAIASMVVSLVSLVLCWAALLVGPVGAILGHISMKEINRNPHQYTNRSMALAGIIIGWVVFGLYAALLVFYIVMYLGIFATSY